MNKIFIPGCADQANIETHRNDAHKTRHKTSFIVNGYAKIDATIAGITQSDSLVISAF